MIDREVLVRRLGLDGAKVLVLGLAVTGRALARALAAGGASVLASDASDAISADVIRELADAGVDVEVGSHTRAEGTLGGIDIVLPSPGISPGAGLLARCLERGVPVVAELDLAQRLTDATIVGVTGTNGKTTVCRLAERIGREAGLDAYACGNTDVPFIEAVVYHPDADLFVVECSSFRLAFAETFHPRVAVFTNFAPDHLDWHRDVADYRDAKARIASRLDADDLYLFPASQPELADLAPQHGPQRVAFGVQRPVVGGGAWIEVDEVIVAIGSHIVRARGAGSLVARGPQFAEDAAAAAAALVFCGAGAAALERAMTSFTPDAHRLERVGVLDGVLYVDDSKATNPHAAVAAIRAAGQLGGAPSSGSVVLIAGGRNKDLDLRPLAAEAPQMRAVVAIGESAQDVVDAFGSTGVGVERASTMEDAVRVAAGRARSGDVVLLAPGCASFDAYVSYAERGDDFQRACRSLGVGM